MNISFLLFFLSLSYTSCAWHLDQACQRLGSIPNSILRIMLTCEKGYDDMVRRGMSGAFDLNKAALDTMRALKDNTHSEAQMDLFEYMYGFAVKQVNGQRRVEERYWKQIYRIFERVETFSTEKEKNHVGIHDVVVYCDYSRYIEGRCCDGTNSLFTACDKDTSKEFSMDLGWRFCRSSSGYVPNMVRVSRSS